MMARAKHLSWIELSRSALRNNIDSLASLASGKLMAVCVKANAYGHGLNEIVTILKDNSQVDYLTVHSLEEAIGCRQAGWAKNIMLLGPMSPDAVEAVFEYDLEPVIFERISEYTK